MPDLLLPLVNLANSYDTYFGMAPTPEYLEEVVAAAHALLEETSGAVPD